jgi:hypothetical protein
MKPQPQAYQYTADYKSVPEALSALRELTSIIRRGIAGVSTPLMVSAVALEETADWLTKNWDAQPK